MKKIIALVLCICALCFSLVSCGEEELGGGWSDYAVSRNTEGRDISYVEICFEDYGKVIVLLDATTAPLTVANFLSLVREGFYDGLYIHRIIENFMIQGGDPKGNGTGGSENKIIGEFLLNGYFENDISHYKGTISMARGDSYNSASSQFFICNADSRRSLDGRYAAFGYVIMGLDVIDEITEDVFPKTGDNGAISKNKDKPVIKYIKELVDYTPNFDYTVTEQE